ncbi:hypothetical protein RHSP_11865 [Rhizobium freirei PRF 81]|uniref:Uncharacterized protein n=1 Tax=Rhizobium freirei PRF 81 TaxID=363754 RepID=N6V529_9HYPH|nr:hypothetical protein [Rhizobium freirei]ENN88251.1 hypothetical protein RHSP_11865 [Rhizobium freirei PRF 81]
MRTVIAEGDAQTIRARAISGITVHVEPAHRASHAFRNACRRSPRLRSGALAGDANDNPFNSAGLILMGYPDTSGAPSADLRR